MASCDIIKLLTDKLMIYVVRNIFSYLDDISLRQAECVCTLWLEIISQECVWKLVLERKVHNTSLWRIFISFKDIEWQIGPTVADGHLYYKNLYMAIKNQLYKLERNWNAGNCRLHTIDCGPGGANLCFQVSEKYIAAGQMDHTVKLWNRNTLHCEKVFQGHSDHVSCLQFDDEILISGSYDETIKIWSVKTTALLNTVGDLMGAVHKLKHKNRHLVSISSDLTAINTVFFLTVCFINCPQNISRETCISLSQFCHDLDLNETYIILTIAVDSGVSDCDIQLISLSTLEVVRTLKGCSQVITGFQLLNNLMVTGSHDKTIRFWDIESGECKRIIEDDEMISCCRFNERYLVTGNYDGRLKIWDFQAACDFQKPKSHSFLLLALENFEEGAMSIALDDFQIIGTSALNGSSMIVIWDFLSTWP